MYPLEKMSEEVELDNEILKGVSSRDTVVVTKGTQALSLWEDECDGDDDEGDWSTIIGP